MNQLFVCVVLLCVVIVSSYQFIKVNKLDKKITIVPLPHSSELSDSMSNMYRSTKSLNVLPNAEVQLNMCNQKTSLIDAEINILQNRITEKKQQTIVSCQNKLKAKIDTYKKLYKHLNNVDISADELTELENKLG